MVLENDAFVAKIRAEPDTAYIKALLEMAIVFSEGWVIEALKSELDTRGKK